MDDARGEGGSSSWAALAASGQRALEAAGWPAEDARRDAVLLARSVLGWDAAQWLVDARREADPAARARFDRLLERRRQHEPVAYLLGEREFYGRSFQVTRAVLIPRPETELIVDEALTIAPSPGDIADIGTGSGCLAITLALELPSARLIATDISRAALDVARTNASRFGVEDRVAFVQGSLLADVPGPVELVVANLPYVAETDRPSLSREVADFEPGEALFGGPDGLALFRALLPSAARTVAPGGRLILEIGQGQLHQVRELVDDTPGLAFSHARPDLQGIPRIVVAQRR
jgi:release factor glutamine methyltransferase